MYPLYIQVIHDRKPIYFKSYFFDLLSKEKYALHYIGGKKTPAQKEIVAKEESVITFLIERENKNFSLDTLQKDYYYYSKDLLNLAWMMALKITSSRFLKTRDNHILH